METLEPTIQGFSGDGSKSSNPASADDRSKLAEGAPGSASDLLGPPAANRHRLQNERSAITHHFAFGGHEGYLTVGFYPNGQPGEIFIRMAKAGSTIAGLMECFGTVVSVSLQHGVPLKVLCDKLSHTRFEPSGWTGNAEIGYAKSVMDYIFPLDGTAVPVRKTTLAIRSRQWRELALAESRNPVRSTTHNSSMTSATLRLV